MKNGGFAYFNPRTPCGVRRQFLAAVAWYKQFQSTHPLRGATQGPFTWAQPMRISIHAPLAGCDLLFFHNITP